MTDRIREFAKRLLGQTQRDDVVGLSAELAYRWFLSLFPFAIFVASAGAFIARQLNIPNPAQLAKDQLTGLLPSEAATLIGEELERILQSDQSGLISFGMLAAIWFATGGTNAIIKAMNRAFDVGETRPLVRRYLVALGLTVVAGGTLIVAFVLVIVGQLIAADVVTGLGIGDAAWDALTIGGWLVAATLIFGVTAALYRIAPNIRLPWRWILPGALVFTLGWLGGTLAFGLYIANFGSYGATFGALAGVAILLIWLYLSAFILLLGAEINDVLAELNEPAEVDERREEVAPEAERQRAGGPVARHPAGG